MKAHTASLINAIVLIVLSAWAYFASATPSFTALIPAVFGVLLLACYKGVRDENKIVAHIAAILTVIVLFGLFTPLRATIEREDVMAIVRVGVMMASTVFALVFFIKSFVDARRRRA